MVLWCVFWKRFRQRGIRGRRGDQVGLRTDVRRYVRAGENKNKLEVQTTARLGWKDGKRVWRRGCGGCFGLRGSKEAVDGCKWTSTEDLGATRLRSCGRVQEFASSKKELLFFFMQYRTGAKGKKVS